MILSFLVTPGKVYVVQKLIPKHYNYPQNTVLISFVRPGKSFRYNTDKEWRTHVGMCRRFTKN